MPLFSRPPIWVALVLTLAACSPTYNWRELRDNAIPLKAILPCKPDRGARVVPLDGQARTLHMHSCEAGGQTFAIGWVDLPAEAEAADVLAAWRQATLATLRMDADRATDPSFDWPVRAPGADLVLGLHATGQRQDGVAVQVHTAYFVHGSRAYQAAIYGQRIPPEVTATFFEALRFP